MPHSVVTWDNFKNDASHVSWSSTPKYPRLVFKQYTVITNEEEIREALNINVFDPLNMMLEPSERFHRHSIADIIMGQPDFILIAGQELRLVIEVKTRWTLSADDLVAAWNQNPPSMYNPLKQIFGYLSHNRLRFGALTTYDQTWFLYRPPENPGQLCISPVIRFNSQQPTLFQCFYYLARLARSGYYCASAPPSLQRPPPPCDEDSRDSHDNEDGYYDDKRDPSYKGKSKRKTDSEDAGQSPVRRSKRLEGGRATSDHSSKSFNGWRIYSLGAL
jgi:hypothetical protein